MRKRVVRIMLAAAVAAGASLVVVVGGQAGGSPRTPSIDWSPSTSGGFDFGLVAVGKTASQTFTLTNSGGSASAALTVTLSGPPTVTITDDTCTATSLGPGKSCTVTVQYAPTSSGPGGEVTLEASGKKAAADATLSIAGHSALVFVASGPAVPGLSPLNENPAHPESSATGTAQVIWDTSTHLMTVNVTFAGLTTPNTAAHIHCCVASPGTTGVATTVPTFTGFPSGVQSGTYTHTFDMTSLTSYNPAFVTAHGGTAAGAEAALLAGMQAGQTYLNIHTTMFPGGEERGFLQS